MNESDLTTLADEIAALKDQLLYSANATIDGKYIFSGYKQDTAPFTENPDYDPDLYDISDSTTWPYIYNGDHNRTELEISPGEYMEVNLTGNELFMGISNDVAATGTTDPLAGGTQGGIDIFTVLTRTEEAIRAGNVDDINGAGGSIEAQLNNLEVAADQNRTFRSTLGLKAAQVETTIGHQEDAAIDLEKTLSRYQDADVIDVFNEIAEQETAFEAALSITGRISRISILDYF